MEVTLDMQHWDLTAPNESGRTGPRVLFSTHEARGVVIDLALDEEMGDHRVRERAIVHVVRGRIAFSCGETAATGEHSTLIVLEPNELHSIRALEETRLLLVLAPWPAPDHYDASEHEDPHELPAHATQQPE